MKKLIPFILILTSFFCFGFTFKNQELAKPMLAIVIDDFGGYEEAGVNTMLSINAPLTCAIMPNNENSLKHAKLAHANNKEIIVHMPMEASVSLPLSWYGPNFIRNFDNKETVYNKLNHAFDSVGQASGFNIHIGSGVCQHKDVVSYIYDYAKENNKFFLDSRTHEKTVCEQVANSKNIIYLGRDEFLEPKGSNSYNTVKEHLEIACNKAKEKGFAIAIGHVGNHGGENTAKAIKDFLPEIQKQGIEIVPLSKIHDMLKNKNQTV